MGGAKKKEVEFTNSKFDDEDCQTRVTSSSSATRSLDGRLSSAKNVWLEAE